MRFPYEEWCVPGLSALVVSDAPIRIRPYLRAHELLYPEMLVERWIEGLGRLMMNRAEMDDETFHKAIDWCRREAVDPPWKRAAIVAMVFEETLSSTRSGFGNMRGRDAVRAMIESA